MNGQRWSLLIVDDERAIADTTATIFTQAGYQVKTAYSAEQALELIQDWSPSAAILDVLLPGMDGVELAKLIQKNHPNCRIVLFSAHSYAAYSGPDVSNDFLTLVKPLHPAKLLAVLGACLEAV